MKLLQQTARTRCIWQAMPASSLCLAAWVSLLPLCLLEPSSIADRPCQSSRTLSEDNGRQRCLASSGMRADPLLQKAILQHLTDLIILKYLRGGAASCDGLHTRLPPTANLHCTGLRSRNVMTRQVCLRDIWRLTGTATWGSSRALHGNLARLLLAMRWRQPKCIEAARRPGGEGPFQTLLREFSNSLKRIWNSLKRVWIFKLS